MRAFRALLIVLMLGVVVVLPAAPVGAQDIEMYPDSAVDPAASANGCGPAGWGWVVPEMGFTPACDWHDRCYGTLGLPQGYCDDGMYERAKKICDDGSPATWADCRHTAALYYWAVSRYGEKPHANGQEEARLRDQGRKQGRFHGDPHMVTFDGLRYGFQVAGEYELIRDERTGESLVQVQFYPRSDTFTVTTGVAVTVGSQIVAAQIHPETGVTRVFVDGSAVTGDLVALDAGFVRFGNEVEGTRGVIQIRTSDRLAIDILQVRGRFDVQVAVPGTMAGRISGLLGNADGDPANDLTVAGEPVSADAVYDAGYRSEWRLAVADSHFVPGEIDYHSDELAAYPLARQDVSDFDDAARARAASVCEDAGVPPEDLDSCIFDVLASGEEGEAAAAATGSQQAERSRDPGGVRLEPDPPLVVAAARGDLAETETLLDDGADPNVGRESDRATPIVFAAQNGHTEVVRVLLDAGALADLQVDDGLTGLILAAQNGHGEIVELLLTAGAYPDGRSDRGLNPLYMAAQNGHTDIVSALSAAGANVESIVADLSTTYIAAQNGHSDIVSVLIDAGALPDGPAPVSRPLLVAAQNGYVDVVMVLVDGGANPDAEGPENDRAIGRAAQSGEVDVVEFLLGVGADPQFVSGGRSPLDRAARGGHVAVLDTLLGAGVDPSGGGDDPALLLAVFSESDEAVRILLEAGANPDQAAADGFTPLMVAAQNGLADIAATLISADADPNLATGDGWTALHAAANRENLEMVRQLVAAGADPASANDQGAVPADYASDASVLEELGAG